MDWAASGAVASAPQSENVDSIGYIVANDPKVQGSKAWHAWRGKGIGSSDAAVLLGWSPWKNVHQLYEEKLGLWKPEFGVFQRQAMDRGTALEPEIRKWYEHYQGKSFTETTAEHPEKPHFRASFDGLNREYVNKDGSIGRMIEIKAPNKDDHALAHTMEVPKKYIPQVQWLMMVGNVPWADYVSYGRDGTYAVVPVKADKRLQKALMERADLFWQHVQTKTDPGEWEEFKMSLETPLDLGKVSPPIDETPAVTETIADQEVETIVAEALIAQVEADAASAKFDALKEKIKKILGTNTEMRRGQAVFGYSKVKGSVDYGSIPELIGIDLEQFRKAETKRFFFKRVDSK